MLNETGRLKLIGFGMARFFNLPIEQDRPDVQALRYRAPEILFPPCNYHTAIDMWSIGVIIAEMSRGVPLFKADSSIELAVQMIDLLGSPQDMDNNSIPHTVTIPQPSARPWPEILKSDDIWLCDLVANLLCYDSVKRISALAALRLPYFDSLPLAVREMCEVTH
jgi:serine/threonine protein kinase